MRYIQAACALIAALALGPVPSAMAGSANDIVQLSPDTYMITRISYAGIFASMGKLKTGVIQDANNFAKSREKLAIAISAQERPVGGPGRFPQFEYQFRLVDPHGVDAKSTTLVPRADVVIENNHNIQADIRSRDETPKDQDLYGELMKLDDLRKKGILTDAEFEAQKQKLLSRN